jgi:myo-inositol-1(or 4)-monophosphatase
MPSSSPAGPELVEIAVEAASAAGRLLLDRFEQPRRQVRAKGSPTDLVSEADHEAEAVIRELLDARRPRDSVLGEEGGDASGPSGLRWVVDPLDGTVNYLFGIPQWSVSVACEDSQGTIAGVVHDPLRDETFTASRAGSPMLNGQAIEASTCQDLSLAMVSTGFAYDSAVRVRQGEIATRVLGRARDLRRLGSAALDLAWTACGRFDAYYERDLKPWDRAAGTLLCQQAGLPLRELAPAEGLPAGLVIAPPALIDELESLVAVRAA